MKIGLESCLTMDVGRRTRKSTNMHNIDSFDHAAHLASMLTPEQCRAARGLLDWTQEELAERAGVSRGTIRGFENGRHELHRGSTVVVRAALEAAGVILIDPDAEYGPGVRLRHGRNNKLGSHHPTATLPESESAAGSR